MKKTLIALAALAATSAFAQSTVTMYGRLDIGYAQGTTSSTANVTAAGVQAAAAATTDTRNNGVLGGDAYGLNTNLWGIKGSEDLGGGMKANFNLEQGIDPSTGATNAGGFNRRSVVGLSGAFGEVNLGRDYTPLFSTAGLSDPFATTGIGAVNLANADGVRASNAVHYVSPNMNGFSAKVMLGVVEGGSNDGTTDKNTSTRNTGLSLNYANGNLAAALAMGTVNTAYAATAATYKAIDAVGGTALDKAATVAGQGKTDASALSVTYNFGVAKLFAGHIRQKAQASTAVETFTEATETNLGVTVPMGKVNLIAAYGRNTGTYTVAGAAAGEYTGNDYALGVTYEMSKRTSLYAKTGVYNKADLTTATGANGGNVKTSATAIGLRHTF